MKTSLGFPELSDYARRQVLHFFPDGRQPGSEWADWLAAAWQRTEFCFRHIRNKYFCANGEAIFDHLHTDQYAMFLYYLSHAIYRLHGDRAWAGKVYALNKALHAVDIFYEVALPDVFYLQHPVGTVLGRADYSNYFVAYQRCSVGSNLDGQKPRLAEGVILFGGSAVIGRCEVGRNAWFSFGAALLDQDVPAHSVVFGRSPQIVIKKTKRDVRTHLFVPVAGAGSPATEE